MPCLRSFMAWS